VTAILSPALVLGALLSTTYAALFHLWQRGTMVALRRYLLAAWLGFAAGHLLGGMLGFHWLTVGDLNVLSGTVCAVAALLIAKSLQA
jgi:hypothetical protein